MARYCLISIEEAYADRAPDADGILRINRYTVSRNYVQFSRQLRDESKSPTHIWDTNNLHRSLRHSRNEEVII